MRAGSKDSDIGRKIIFLSPPPCPHSHAPPAFRIEVPQCLGVHGSQHMTTLAIATRAVPNRLATLLRGDARHFQIAALASLLAFNLGWIDFGAKPLNSLLAVAAALATQVLCTRI